MELRIISTEIIKPSSPTPPQLKTHKLSLLDQLAPDIYFPLAVFYSDAVVDKNTPTNMISHQLKKSLSKTLTYYYPFAGRVNRDDYSVVDCDDSGVPFIEAHVACNMFEVLKNPEINLLEKLLPFKPNENLNTQVNMAIQLNHFDCGGLAICVNYRHILADASAGVNFVKNWGTVACGDSNSNDIKIKDVIFDCTSIFPPHDSIPSICRSINENLRSTDCITKRFMFDAAKIDSLKKKIIDNASSMGLEYRPTRFEAVAALIWGALIAIDRESSNNSSINSLASIPVNLRHRMNPPLPPQCIGNIYHAVTANASWFMDKAIDYNMLARNIHKFTKMVNDDFVRKAYDDGAFVKHYGKEVDEFLKTSGRNQVRILGLNGLIGLPYYEIDFGWGKPIWFTTVLRLHNVIILLNTCDGKGVEAWVGLPNKDMHNFEQDLGILTYASFNTI